MRAKTCLHIPSGRNSIIGQVASQSIRSIGISRNSCAGWRRLDAHVSILLATHMRWTEAQSKDLLCEYHRLSVKLPVCIRMFIGVHVLRTPYSVGSQGGGVFCPLLGRSTICQQLFLVWFNLGACWPLMGYKRPLAFQGRLIGPAPSLPTRSNFPLLSIIGANMSKRSFGDGDLVTLFTGTALISGLVTKFLSFRELELQSQALSWATLPILTIILRRIKTTDNGPSSEVSASSLWIVAVGIATFTVFHAERGPIALAVCILVPLRRRGIAATDSLQPALTPCVLLIGRFT